MNLERLFSVARPKIDEIVTEARAQRRAMAVIVDELLGKAHIVSRGRQDACDVVLADERLDPAVRRRVAAQLASAPLEQMPVVLVSGTATSATADVKIVRRAFVEPGFDIEAAKRAGRFLVETLRVLPDEKERAWLDRYAEWATENPAHPHALAFREERWEAQIGWLLTWTLQAFQRVEVPARKAAELMGTNTGDDPDAMTCRPWDAYTVEISDELIAVPFDEGIVRFGIISVWHSRDSGQTLLIARSRTMDRTILGPRQFPLPPLNMAEGDPAKQATERAIDCIAALTVGTELTMSNRAHVKAPASKKNKRGAAAERAEPSGVHRIIAPVTIDCREHISEYIAGTARTAPKTRTFVCGFWKRVVHGPGRTSREWRQFPPGWRNLNADRVAIRTHRIRDDEE